MRVAFRCDASERVGYGHVMRCLALAGELREQGADAAFICRNEKGHLGNLIVAQGHELHWLGTCRDQADDAAGTRSILDDRPAWDWLVVDHYQLDRPWEANCRGSARKLMVIDDLTDRPHDCDLFLDQNLAAPMRPAEMLAPGCAQLLGPRFALLRSQFRIVRANMRHRAGTPEKLLIMFGGADAAGGTLLALDAIDQVGEPRLRCEVVVGEANPHRDAIEAAVRKKPSVTIRRQTEDVAVLMSDADIFIGSGGTSSWERCCLSLPAIVVATAENQAPQCEALARAGAHLYLGRLSTVTPERLANVIAELIRQPELLQHMSLQASVVVDGRGAERVARRMQACAIDLRRADADDSDAIFAWRNHQETRRFAFDHKPIPRSGHDQWFSAVLADSTRELLIAECLGEPVGVLRYDFSGVRCLVSIYVIPGLGGLGWGARMLFAGEDWLRINRPDVRFCDAEIAPGNEASVHAFTEAGFVPCRYAYAKELYG